MIGVRCAICGKIIISTDSTAERHGQLMHLRCLETRKPGSKVEPPLKNRRDDQGDPICPVCGRSIDRRTTAVARAEEFMVHVDCQSRVREQSPP